MTAAPVPRSQDPSRGLEAEKRHLAGRLREGRIELLGTAAASMTAEAVRRLLRIEHEIPTSLILPLMTLTPMASATTTFALFSPHPSRGLVILGWLFSLGLLALVTAQHLSRILFRTMSAGVVPALRASADVATLGRWLQVAFSMRWQTLFTGAAAVGITVAAHFVFLKTNPPLGGAAFLVAVAIPALMMGQALYMLVPALVLPQLLRKTGLTLFSIDPAQSKVVLGLSDLIKTGTLLAAANASLFAGGLYWWSLLDTPRSLAIVTLVLWTPFIALFAYHHLSLGDIILATRAETLGTLQEEIDRLSPDRVAQTDKLKSLLTLHDRVRDSRTLALDGKQVLTLVNSLLVPLLAPFLKLLLD